MGQGGHLNVVNVTRTALTRGHYHSYQMKAWDGSFPARIEPLSASQVYVQWEEGLFTTKGDDAGEARYQADARNLFEIQARWRHLQVLCFHGDRAVVVGVLRDGAFNGDKPPEWHSLQGCHDLGWNGDDLHDANMTVALVDLRLIFAGAELEHYIQGIQGSTLTTEEKKKLYRLAGVWSGHRKVDWKYTVDEEGPAFTQPKPPPPKHVILGQKSEIFVGEGSKVTEHLSFSKEFTETTEFTLSQELTLGLTVKWGGKVDIGFGADFTASIKLGKEEKNLHSVNTTYAITDIVELDPGVYDIEGYLDWVDGVELPFTMRCNITAKQDTYPIASGMLENLLLMPKYNNGFTGKIILAHDDTVLVTLDGVIKTSRGMKRHLSVRKGSPAPALAGPRMPAPDESEKILIEERTY